MVFFLGQGLKLNEGRIDFERARPKQRLSSVLSREEAAMQLARMTPGHLRGVLYTEITMINFPLLHHSKGIKVPLAAPTATSITKTS